MNLEQLMKAGLITQADIDRMLERATGEARHRRTA